MDCKKNNNEHADDDERMQFIIVQRGSEPGNEYFHLRGRLEGARGFKHGPDSPAIRPEGLDVIVELLVRAAVPLVPDGVFQQVAVKLPDVVFRRRNDVIAGKDRVHDGGVAGDLLFIAACKNSNVDSGKKPVDLAVCEPGPFNTGR